MTTATETTFTKGQTVLVDGREAEYVEPATCGCCQHVVKYAGTDYNDFVTSYNTIVAKAQAEPFPVGSRVSSITYGTGTIVARDGALGTGLNRAVELDDKSRGPGYFGGGVFTIPVTGLTLLDEPASEPTVASGDLADALRRAERAEMALQAFRDQVRQAVIDEAADQGWCDRTDEWLESIGLEPREPQSRTYVATVDVTTTVSVSVEAADEDDAGELIDEEMVKAAIADNLGIGYGSVRYLDISYDVSEIYAD